MTKNEFLATLAHELIKNKVADAADIICEYEQHFAFKMADGFSEEEIAAKLGNPIAHASQFESSTEGQKRGGRKITTMIGLCFVDLFAGVFFALLVTWEAVMAVFSLTCAVIAVCLLGGLNIYSLIPPMPYWCGAIFGLSFVSLSVLVAVGCVYFTAFMRQLMRSFGRFHHNTIAASSGNAILPSLATYPRLAPKTNRRLRSIALIALAVFAASSVLGMIVSMISSGALGFWHAWGWFGYKGIN